MFIWPWMIVWSGWPAHSLFLSIDEKKKASGDEQDVPLKFDRDVTEKWPKRKWTTYDGRLPAARHRLWYPSRVLFVTGSGWMAAKRGCFVTRNLVSGVAVYREMWNLVLSFLSVSGLSNLSIWSAGWNEKNKQKTEKLNSLPVVLDERIPVWSSPWITIWPNGKEDVGKWKGQRKQTDK